MIDFVEREKYHTFPQSWESLHRAADQWVRQTSIIDDKRRSIVSRQLKVAMNSRQLSGTDVINYLDNGIPPYEIVRRLIVISRQSCHCEMTYKIFQKLGENYPLINDDLEDLFQMSHEMGDNDLAWRICTILKSRKALNDRLTNVWSISGEKRREYQFYPCSLQTAIDIIPTKNVLEHKFLVALVKVGGAIPQLLHSFGMLAKPSILKSASDLNGYRSTLESMDSVLWLKPLKSLSSENGDPFRSLPFAQSLPINSWTIVWSQLIDRIGISSWNWSPGWLKEKINDLVPRFTHQTDRRYMSKMSRWLRSLHPNQKSAWYEFVNSIRQLADERCLDLLIRFTSRLSLVMYQNNLEALVSLQEMRIDLEYLRSLEGWIISQQYSQLRRKLGFESRVPVPLSLQKKSYPLLSDSSH